MNQSIKKLLLNLKRKSALKFNGTDNYLNIGTLPGMGATMTANGFFLEFDMATVQTTAGLFGMSVNGSFNQINIMLNQDQNFSGSSGKIGVQFSDNSANQLTGATSSATNFNDGKRHTITITCNFSTRVLTIAIDGSSKAISYLTQGGLSNIADLPTFFTFGQRNGNGTPGGFFACTVGNIKIGTLSKLFGVYPTSEGIGLKTADVSGNKNVGTLVKGAGDYPLWVPGL